MAGHSTPPPLPFCAGECAVSFCGRLAFYRKSMDRPRGRKILLAQNDFMCQIFAKIDADYARALLPQMALLMADINGAYAQSALSCRTRVGPGVGFKCTLSLIRVRKGVWVAVSACPWQCVLPAVNVRLSMGANNDYAASCPQFSWLFIRETRHNPSW